MLPWHEIRTQLQAYSLKRRQALEQRGRLKQVIERVWNEIFPEQWQALRQRSAEERGSLLPDFHEAPCRLRSVTGHDEPAVVVASDGSQIFPSQHEIAPVALISVSRIRLNYADPTDEPILSTEGKLLTEPPVDTGAEEQGPRFEDQVSDQRAITELGTLADLAQAARKQTAPVFAMVDGSLILWRLAGREDRAYERQIINAYVERLAQFQQIGTPVCGYISGSGSRELVKLVEFAARYAQISNEPLTGYTDAALLTAFMQPGERTPLFESRSKILSAYGDQRVGYFYLHAGEEIAKIEAPLWVGKNEAWLNALAAQCVDQAHLGGGYPVILAEAHEQAVIRGPDREMFYALLEESLLEAGLTPQRSIKQLRKRVGIL